MVILEENLFHQDLNVRNSALTALNAYIRESPQDVNLQGYVDKLKSHQTPEILEIILKLTIANWNLCSNDLITLLLQFLRSKNQEIKKLAQKGLTEMGLAHPEKIVQKLQRILLIPG